MVNVGKGQISVDYARLIVKQLKLISPTQYTNKLNKSIRQQY